MTSELSEQFRAVCTRCRLHELLLYADCVVFCLCVGGVDSAASMWFLRTCVGEMGDILAVSQRPKLTLLHGLWCAGVKIR